MARYIGYSETIILVRQELKDIFPGIKFSVRKTSYTRGTGIDITWSDGPAYQKVVDALAPFKQTAYGSSTLYKGEEVRFGSSHIYCARTISRVFLDQLTALYYTEFGHDVSFRVELRGTYVDTTYLNAAQLHWFRDARRTVDAAPKAKKTYTYKSKATKAEEAYEAYRKQYEREQEQRERDYIKREEDRRRAEYARAQEERQRQQERARRKSRFYTRVDALKFLGLSEGATVDEIKSAFRAKVKAAADGHGGYKGDMDVLTQAKEKALAA